MTNQIYMLVGKMVYIMVCTYTTPILLDTVHREKWCAIFNMFLCATFNTTHLSVLFLYAI